MNSDLPYIKSTENRFYAKSSPSGATPTVRGMAASVIEQAQRLPSKITFNRAYAVDLKTGVLRLVLIIFLTCGWISAAAVPKNADQFSAYGQFSSTRTAYLFFSLLAFFLYLIIYLLNVLNIAGMDKLRGIPWNLINFVLDLFFLLTMFSVSVAAAVRESQLNKTSDIFLRSITNKGAFGSAAAFGFMSVLVLAWFVGQWAMYILKDRNNKPGGGNAANLSGPAAFPNTTASSGINQIPKPSSQFKGFPNEDRTENI